jgi:hypothetical protein
MDDESKAIIALLEARILELETKCDFRWNATKNNCSILEGRLENNSGKTTELIQLTSKLSDHLCNKDDEIKLLSREQLRVRHEMMKYDDAYYNIFPDRLAQDVQVHDQIAALTSKPEPKTDPKKP